MEEPKWAVGLITAPRKGEPTVQRTLESLKKAGWDDVVVFAEPGAPVEHNKVVRRPDRYGDFTNWFTGLVELIISHPRHKYIMMLEDDVVLVRNLRQYLDLRLPKLTPFASASVFCPSYFTRYTDDLWERKYEGEFTLGTQTVCMTREMALEFISDRDVVRHRSSGVVYFTNPSENTAKDIVIGVWAQKRNLPVCYHNPSLAQHIGDNSTLRSYYWKAAQLSAQDFVGEDFDALDLLKGMPTAKQMGQVRIV